MYGCFKQVKLTIAVPGFTGLAHPSPLEIGATHGVYVLEGSVEGDGLKRKCRKFLHKPSLDIMRSMKGCVHEMKNEDGAKEMVLTDSSYFISPPAMIKLLNLYNEHLPLTCELDAYGDFLQVRMFVFQVLPALGH